LEHLLFVLYLVFFAWLVTKTGFFLASGLSKSQLIILFFLKVIAGIFYGWVGIYYGGLAQMIDTWAYHSYALDEYKLLGSNPHEYLTNLFHNPYENGLSNFFGSSNSYWNDLKTNIFIKTLSVFDIFSFGHYYVNVIFYSYLTFFGPIALYRVMHDAFPGRKIVVLLSVFFVPSLFYWSSGIHKEGLIFAGISLIIYHFYFGTKEKKFGVKRIAGILLGLFLLLVLRNFLIVVMIPAMLAWSLANRWPAKRAFCFATVYMVFILLFFTLKYISPRLDFPKAVVDKQQAFMQIVGGNSTIPIKRLKPDAISFLKNTPQAITLSAIRPYPSDIKHLLSLAAALEVNLLLLLFLFSLFWRRKEAALSTNLIYFCLFFSISLILSIGFSVNNLGAIVRYRSVTLPLLVVLMGIRINWQKVGSFFSRSINFKNNINKAG
jgi:hypothetical protein